MAPCLVLHLQTSAHLLADYFVQGPPAVLCFAEVAPQKQWQMYDAEGQ